MNNLFWFWFFFGSSSCVLFSVHRRTTYKANSSIIPSFFPNQITVQWTTFIDRTDSTNGTKVYSLTVCLFIFFVYNIFSDNWNNFHSFKQCCWLCLQCSTMVSGYINSIITLFKQTYWEFTFNFFHFIFSFWFF